jgi:uncharacterized protein YbjT (DUF2867 family)
MGMNRIIAVAGGTGTVGRHVVDAARKRGYDVRVLARSTGVDLITGEGLDRALDGVEAVIDTANLSTTSADASVAFFGTTTRTMLEAEARASVRHHVALSIVGVDRAPEGYYAGKAAQEALVAAGPVPWTIQRATQFHDFAAQLYAGAKLGPVHLAPRMRTQPVSTEEVAEALIGLVEAGPSGRARDLAGPREEALVDMIRAYARAIGHRGWIPAINLPGALGRAQRDGSLLPSPDAERGRQTFAEWVEGVERPL